MADVKKVETKVEKVEVNLDEIFNGAPGAESITLPEEESKKPNVFSRSKDVDLSFIDKPAEEEAKTEEPAADEANAGFSAFSPSIGFSLNVFTRPAIFPLLDLRAEIIFLAGD